MAWILLIGKAPFVKKTPKKIQREILKFNWNDYEKNQGFENITPNAKDFLRKAMEPNHEERWSA